MLQTHVARVNEENDTEGGKNGKAGSVTGGLDSHTDAQMGKMTDRLKVRQAGWLIFCYASHCRRTPI